MSHGAARLTVRVGVMAACAAHYVSSSVFFMFRLIESLCCLFLSILRWSSLTSARCHSSTTWGPKDCEHSLFLKSPFPLANCTNTSVRARCIKHWTVLHITILSYIYRQHFFVSLPGKGWSISARADIVSLAWTAAVTARPATAGPNGAGHLSLLLSLSCFCLFYSPSQANKQLINV